MGPNLLMICITAMLAVFLLLGMLALAMRALMAVFPERATGDDGPMLAAMAAAVAAAYPGTTITNVTELR